MEEQKKEKIIIRSKRKSNWFWIDNELIDIYSKILDGNTIKVYLKLVRLSGNGNICYPSLENISKDLSLSVPTIIDRLKVLEFFKIIKKERIGKKCTNRYWLLDKRNWRKDFDVILKILKSGDFKDFKITTRDKLIVNLKSLKSNSTNKIKNKKLIKDKSVARAKALPQELIDELSVLSGETTINGKEKLKGWNWDLVLNGMLKHKKRRDFQVIALYWKFKGIKFENKEQFEAGLKRELRAAKNLKGYSNERIIETMEFLSYDPAVKWTLETVHKYIDENLNELEPLQVKNSKGRL